MHAHMYIYIHMYVCIHMHERCTHVYAKYSPVHGVQDLPSAGSCSSCAAVPQDPQRTLCSSRQRELGEPAQAG